MSSFIESDLTRPKSAVHNRGMAETIGEKLSPINVSPKELPIPRRRVLAGIAATIGGGIAAVFGIRRGGESVQRLLRASEQAAAAELFDKTPLDKRITNLVVDKDGAILRSTPDSISKSNIIGWLDADLVVEEAIQVEGNNPDFPSSKYAESKGVWYFTPRAVDSQGRLTKDAFSYSGNFRKPSLKS